MDSSDGNQDQETALVLSGGGAKGAFQVGALQALREAGFSFNAVSGISVGSLNGAMLATNQFDDLLKVWHQITPDRVYQKNSLVSLARQYLFYKLGFGDPPTARYENKPLQELMKHYFIGKQVTLPFHFGYVKLESGKYVQSIIRRTNGHVVDKADLKRLLASTAIPVYFKPVRLGDDWGVDGGVRNISPIKEVLPYNPDRMVIIPTRPLSKDPASTRVRDILEIAFRSIDIMLDEIFHEDIDRFLTINRLVKQAEANGLTLTKSDGSSYQYIEPILIAPREPLGDALNFGNQHVQNIMEKGKRRAEEVINDRNNSLV